MPAHAELAGAFAADGCMQKPYLCFWGNITEDREYYDTILCNLFQNTFGILPKTHQKISNSVYGFYICTATIRTFFHNVLEFPIGAKTYTVKVPKIILSDTALYPAFIRGFADGDGCIHFSKRKGTASLFKQKRHTYPRIFLTSVSHQLVEQVGTMLDSLGIKHTILVKKISKKQKVSAKIITIRGSYRLKQWMKKIGFNNPVHQTKVAIWERFGYCPAHTTLSQRKAILNNEINPELFY